MCSQDLDSIDKAILAALQGDLDESPEPYARMAQTIGLSELEVIRRIRNMLDLGVIRRLGAMIRHIEAGIGFNGMVVWKVEPHRIEEIGELISSQPEVTHCYERPPFGANGGTLFTMVHASTEQGCLETVRRISGLTGLTEYEILFSDRELKKISMTYFTEEDQSPDDRLPEVE